MFCERPYIGLRLEGPCGGRPAKVRAILIEVGGELVHSGPSGCTQKVQGTQVY